jgi:hypothetical protein
MGSIQNIEGHVSAETHDILDVPNDLLQQNFMKKVAQYDESTSICLQQKKTVRRCYITASAPIFGASVVPK